MRGLIRFIRRQHFWIVAPVILLVMIATWFLAAGEQIKKFEEGTTKIKNHFQAMSGVQSINPHPNEEWHNGMDQYIQQRAQDVDSAWATQYAKQVETMKWSPEMKPAFLALVDQMRPIENITEEAPILNEVQPWMLQSYRDFIIETELERLASIIGARWTVDATEGGGGGYGAAGGGYGGYGGYGGGEGGGAATSGDAAGGGYGGYGGGGGGYGGYGGGGGGYGGYGGGGEEGYDDEEFNPIIVNWNPDCQSKIVANSFGWLTRTAKGEPTVSEMLYSQEDLWVLDSMMQVIKATNGDARHRSQAIVKEIMALDIGIAARRLQGKVSAVQSAESEEDELVGYGGDMAGGDPYGGMGMMDMEMGDDFDDEGGFIFDPLEERYVDATYTALVAEDVRSKASSQSLSDVMVAKRMPVRIRVKMDSRKLGKFLAACANAPLTFEVHQIRINPDDTAGMGGFGAAMGGYGGYGGYGGEGGAPSSGGDGYGGYGGAGGGYGGYGGAGASGGYGGYGGAGGGGGGGGYGGEGDLYDEGPPPETYDKTIEFFGVINIYNPVDKEKLGTAPSSGDDADADTDATNGDEEGDLASL